MPIAYILIKSKPGEDKKILDKLPEVPYVTEFAWLNSAYDIVAKVNAPTIDDIGKVHFDHIREMPGVEDSIVMIASIYREVTPKNR